MMIPDIREYDRRRNGVDQKHATGPHIVYVVRPQAGTLHKIGRTRDLRRRLASYESNSGEAFEVRLQICVSSLDDAKRLELVLIKRLSARFEKRKREWFIGLDHDLREEISLALTESGVSATSVGGRMSHSTPDYDHHLSGVRDTRRNMRQYKNPSRIF